MKLLTLPCVRGLPVLSVSFQPCWMLTLSKQKA